jgi:hypothetical protein
LKEEAADLLGQLADRGAEGFLDVVAIALHALEMLRG